MNTHSFFLLSSFCFIIFDIKMYIHTDYNPYRYVREHRNGYKIIIMHIIPTKWLYANYNISVALSRAMVTK